MLSLKRNRLKSDASTFQKPGPMSDPRSMSPNVPTAGRLNALPGEPMGVALNQRSSVPPPSVMSPITFGRFGPASRSWPASR